ncbi:phage head closure protein [Paraflavitalea pollutisoli]|uniref:phage head closure protein n=1 Tax=Paraflavitalea pollutisoli TaxID=3034143 RepID=UPI0023ED4E98|nr:phage head closure protein [Paraflavitalea sp. H1-2-19X]
MAKVPTVGQMNKVIKFELMAKSSDETGGQNEQGKSWFTTRGYYKENSGARSFQNGHDFTVTTGTMWVHWRQAIENDISKDSQIMYDNRFFEIQHYRLVDEKRRIYEIEVKEAR